MWRRLRKEQARNYWGIDINMVPSKRPHHIREWNLVLWVVDYYIWLEKYNSWCMLSERKVIFRGPANQYTCTTTRNWNSTSWCIADERARIENWSLVYSFLLKSFSVRHFKWLQGYESMTKKNGCVRDTWQYKFTFCIEIKSTTRMARRK